MDQGFSISWPSSAVAHQTETLEQSQLEPHQSESPGQETPPTSKKLRCKYPGCTKSFSRNEHLNRHGRSHEPTRPHKCYICNRSFARKDVLHRHVLQHNTPPGADDLKRTLLACEACRRRKVKCDSNEPCSGCEASSIPCVRRSSSSQSRGSQMQQVDQHQHQHQQQSDNGNAFEADGGIEDGVDNDDDGQDDYLRWGWDASADDEANRNWSRNRNHLENQTHTKSAIGSVSGNNNDNGVNRSYQTPGRTISSTAVTAGPGSVAANDSVMAESGPRPASQTSRSIISQATITPPNDLPGTNDFIMLMDSIDSNTVNQMLPLPQSINLLSPLAHLETLFHQMWPLLHLPTLSSEMANPALVQAQAHVRDWVQQKSLSESVVWDISAQSKLLQGFIQTLTSNPSLRVTSIHPTMSMDCIQTVQALALIISCAITGNSPLVVFEWAVWCASLCTAYLRQMGVFQGNCKLDQSFPGADAQWVVEEQLNRLAATFLRIDAYLGLILSRAPTLRWPEMRFRFPVPDTIWRATVPDERRVLLWHEPAGRHNTPFRTIIRERLMHGRQAMPRPRQLLMEDYNLILCALLSDVWDVTQEARYHDNRTYKDPVKDADQEVATWRLYLQDLRGHMELDYNLEATFFRPTASDDNNHHHHQNLSLSSPSSSSFQQQSSLASSTTTSSATNNNAALAVNAAVMNLTMYHMLQLMMAADIPVLETSKCCENCGDLGLSMRIRMWASGPSGRHAVVHAAQLRRIHEREMAATSHDACLSGPQRRVSNPLRGASLFAGAVVLCSYAARAVCLHDINQAVELMQPEMEGGRACGDVERWVEEGSGPRGPYLLGLPLCPCALLTLVAWYRKQLGPGSPFTQRLQKFETTL